MSMNGSQVFDLIAARIDGRIAIRKNEAVLLAEMVAKSRLHVEIGCLWGGTAILAALVGAEKVITIDPMRGSWWASKDPATGTTPNPERVIQNICEFGVEDQVEVMQTYSHPWPLNGDQEPDSIFIDGDHSYKGCLQDWHNAKSRANRFVIFHDYDNDHPGVKQVINEILSSPDGWERTHAATSLVVFERL